MLPAANTPIPFQKPPPQKPGFSNYSSYCCITQNGSVPVNSWESASFLSLLQFSLFSFSFFKPLHTYIWLMLLFSTFLRFIAWWTQNLPLICWQHVISSTQGWQAIFYLNYCKPVCRSRGRWMCLTLNFPLNGELYVPLRKAFQENACWKMPSSLTVNGCKSISG